MKHYLVLPLVTLLAGGLAQFAVAQAITTSHTLLSREQSAAIEPDNEHQAKEWGLQTDEWARYRELMRGPLGIHSPTIDPLTVLGIEARSEEERRRYAELQVQVEARRVEKLLAYQRAYDAAWKRLYPTLQPLNLTDIPSASLTPDDANRLTVFVKDNCPDCEQRVKQLQAIGTAFDLYMVDSHNDDALIRTWAKQVNIDPAKVRTRVITLNHDTGYWLSLSLPGELPAIVRKVNDQWQRQ